MAMSAFKSFNCMGCLLVGVDSGSGVPRGHAFTGVKGNLHATRDAALQGF
jgi:hypothetical protein